MPEKPVWENLSVYSLPVVYGHQHSGQPTQCLDGLVKYAAEIADRSESYVFDTPAKIMRWICSASRDGTNSCTSPCSARSTSGM